ncbi:MAG TPA: PKD domain-containing protein [Polyangia bacterium]
MLRFARAISIAAALAAATAHAAPVARLQATSASGTAPLVVGFDTARSSAGTIAEHLLLTGNGDAISLAMAEQTTNYNYTVPGFYLAQTWLRDESGVALSAPVAIVVARDRDGLLPPSASVTVAATTDPLTFAFMATVTARDEDPIATERWDFGDGASSAEAAPFHAYAQGGIYQAALVAVTRAGMPLYARAVVVVRDASGAVPPSLLLTASPEDASVLTPVTLTAYVEGVTPDAKVTSAEVTWPDFSDASPTVTPTTSGLTLTSQHALTAPGSYDVPVTIVLASQMTPLSATARLTVANIDGSAPSPVLLAAPAPTATVGAAYSPGSASGVLLAAGDGPFAFGPAAPSPSNLAVSADGRVDWTPTSAQVGFQRLAVRITDVQGRESVASWVVQVGTAKKSGCAMAAGASSPSSPWPLVLVGAALWLRRRARYGVTARQAPEQGT